MSTVDGPISGRAGAVGVAREMIGAVPRYYRRRWDEPRGDAYESWGPATYFFEVPDDEWRTLRQIEVYDDGHVLRYDLAYDGDEFGFLSDQPGCEDDFALFAVDRDTFDAAWRRAE